MPILVTCPCGCSLRARDDQAGKQCKCPGCGSILLVPRPAPPTPSLPPVQVEVEPPNPIQLGYAGTEVGRRADPLIHGGGERPIPVIAKPSQDIAKLDRTWRGYVWWVLLLAMVPLALIGLRNEPHLNLDQRIDQTLKKNPQTQPVFGSKELGYPDLDEAIMSLPGQRLDGAYLSRHSVFPLLYALIAAVVYVLIASFALPAERVRPSRIFLTGLFTATGGVLLLLGIQSFPLLCCVHAFYLAALHPDAPFGPSLIGFVLGVGVCEEIIKAIPILWLMWWGNLLNWRSALIIGLASGAGFGLSEALMYSFRYYNGIEPAETYVLRYTSCIAFHTLLTGACAMLIQRKQEHLLADNDPINWTLTLMAIIIIPIFLHGLFNVFAKKEEEGRACAVAVGSFIWLALLIRGARAREHSVATALPSGPKVIKTARGTRWISPAPQPKRKR